ncbi:mRNA-capping enzyme [Thalictrum thalictroides]|uniref:mRNA guanylyltransferase n=1 Tax=Thalictrum thalictroides TaxID=46969 RepID=A0A7J6W4C7_THATH|nr:mRNA-capping enzyme [Thalictrum thalictroides]
MAISASLCKRVYPSPVHLSPEQVSNRLPLLPLPPQVVFNNSLPYSSQGILGYSPYGLLGCSPYGHQPIRRTPHQVSNKPPLLPLTTQQVFKYFPKVHLPPPQVFKKLPSLLPCHSNGYKPTEQVSKKPPLLPLPADPVCKKTPHQVQLPPLQEVSQKPPLLPLPADPVCKKTPHQVQLPPLQEVSQKPPHLQLPPLKEVLHKPPPLPSTADPVCKKTPHQVQLPPYQVVSEKPLLLPLPPDPVCKRPQLQLPLTPQVVSKKRSLGQLPLLEQVSKKPRCVKAKTCLPRGWLRCPSYGQPIDHIIPSKVPVSEYSDDELIKEPTNRYPLQKFLTLGTERKEIGLVINMTNNRYYQPLDWIEKGIKHVKIACKGENSIPDNASVNKFVFEVLKFMSEGQSKYILVHCTHGYNNTGYMIVHYLMRTRSISVTAALDIFAKARPPGIFKQNYIDELYACYHESKPQTVVCPSTPEWKNCLYPLDLNTIPMIDDDHDDGSNAPVCQTEKIHVTKNDDVLGDAITNEQQDVLREACYRLLKLDKGTKGHSQFPGSRPLSLTRNNLELLRKRYFYVTWSTVGTRYLMLITWDGCYLIDENFFFRRVHMRFPLKKIETGARKETHNFTLLDGEMVIDTVPETGKKERRYLIHDLIAINNMSIAHLPFHERWKMLEKQIIEPRNLERQFIHHSRIPNYRYDMETFRVRRKDFWPLSTVAKLLTDFIPKLSHEADGLIFQCWDDPYVPQARTDTGLLKWKYSYTVSFLFEIDKNNRQLLFLHERGQKKLMEGERIVFDKDLDPSEFSGRIIECSTVSNKVWKSLGIKTDKTVPNTTGAYFKVLKNLKTNITKNLLMNEVTETVRHPTYTSRQQTSNIVINHIQK